MEIENKIVDYVKEAPKIGAYFLINNYLYLTISHYHYNCVNLHTGRVHSVSNHKFVNEVNVEIVINNKPLDTIYRTGEYYLDKSTGKHFLCAMSDELETYYNIDLISGEVWQEKRDLKFDEQMVKQIIGFESKIVIIEML